MGRSVRYGACHSSGVSGTDHKWISLLYPIGQWIVQVPGSLRAHFSLRSGLALNRRDSVSKEKPGMHNNGQWGWWRGMATQLSRLPAKHRNSNLFSFVNISIVRSIVAQRKQRMNTRYTYLRCGPRYSRFSRPTATLVRHLFHHSTSLVVMGILVSVLHRTTNSLWYGNRSPIISRLLSHAPLRLIHNRLSLAIVFVDYSL